MSIPHIPAARVSAYPVVIVGPTGPGGPSGGPTGPTGPTGTAGLIGPTGISSFPEAPMTHQTYGRMDAAWARVLAVTNDVLDGGNY